MMPWTTIRKRAAIGLATVATAFLLPSALIAQEASSIEVALDQNTTVVVEGDQVIVNGEVVADGATVTVDGATVSVDGGSITVEQATDGGSVEVKGTRKSKGGKGGSFTSARSSSGSVSVSSSSSSHSSQSVSVSSGGGVSSSSSNVSVQVVSQNGETKVSISR